MTKQYHDDPLGEAIDDYFRTNKEAVIQIHSHDVESYELPVSLLFRKYADMPRLEQLALDQCRGSILDIGAGAGCHAIELQQRGSDVEALEISPKACAMMQEIGIHTVHTADIFEFTSPARYDTLLMLMNGIGIAGSLTNFKKLLAHFKNLLAPNGQILFDTSDLIYLYNEEAYNLNAEKYYGEISCRMTYKNIRSPWFNWLYLDAGTLQTMANEEGYGVEVIAEGNHYDYLVKLTR